MLFVLKKLGPSGFEQEYGAGALDASWPRGRKPVELTDMFARTYGLSQTVIEDLPRVARKETARVVLCAADGHEHALFIVERALHHMGCSAVMAGSELNPAEIVRAALAGSAEALVVSTYNGVALDVGRALRQQMDIEGLSIPVFMGGRLNQVAEGAALPWDVFSELDDLGFTPCRTIPELLRVLDDMVLLAG